MVKFKKNLSRWLPFFLVAILVVSLLGTLFRPSPAAANNITWSGGGTYLLVTLQGAKKGASYNLSGTLTGNSDSVMQQITFTELKGGTYNGEYISSSIENVGCAENSPTPENYIIDVKASSGSSKGEQTYTTCSLAMGINDATPVNLTVSSSTQYGSLTGTLTWQSAQVGSNGQPELEPFPSTSTVALTGPAGAPSTLTLNDQGKIVGPTQINGGMPAGNYKLTVTYAPTDPADGLTSRSYSDSFTITAGNTANVTGTAEYAGAQTSGQSSSSSSGSSSTTVSCLTDDDPLSWMLCPVFDAVAHVSDWLFSEVVQPELRTSPISTSPSDPSFKIWSSFRVYGDIFLIIALLVVVFGQSIGGGLIDAYTVKKVLPRLLLAAVLINLSIYIVAGLVDIINIIGGGIGQVMTAPLAGQGAFAIRLNGVQAAGIIGFSGTAVISGFLIGLFGLLTGNLAHLLAWVGLFLVMPVVFGLLAAFITLIVRKAIILALILVSPVAFALYCLPNTEKYFRKWWEFLFRTLLVYPIVIVFFAVADILSVTIMGANNVSGLSPGLDSASVLAAMIAFFLQFLPLLFIPYAFRLAGGAVGKMHEVLTSNHHRLQEGIKGSTGNPYSLRNNLKRYVAGDLSETRAQNYRNFKSLHNKGGWRGKVAGGLATATTLFGDPLAREAELNEASKRRVAQIKDNGDDAILNARASFIDTRKLLPDGTANPDFNQRMTLDGKRVHALDWKTANRVLPNQSDVQAVADYRSTKINTTQEAIDFARNFGMMAQQQGLTPEQTTSIFTGLAFARQHERGEFKHGKFIRNATTGAYEFHAVGDAASMADGRSDAFVKEQYSKRGTYAASQQLSSYYQSMGDVKKAHLDKLEALQAKRNSGVKLTAAEQTEETHSSDQLKQIIEIQDQYERGGRIPDPDNPREYKEMGLAGATAESQAAFNKMKALDYAPGPGLPGTPATPTTPGSPAIPPPANMFVDKVRKEIAAGQTYEATHTPDPGDFTDRYS